MMMQRRGFYAALLSSAFLFAGGSLSVPAATRGLNIAVTGSGLVVHGIPLPIGAEPSMAGNLALENLQAMAPVGRDLGSGRLRAVLYEMQEGAAPAAVAGLHRDEVPRALAVRRATPGYSST